MSEYLALGCCRVEVPGTEIGRRGASDLGVFVHEVPGIADRNR